MPSSLVRTFGDPDAYASGIRGATAEITTTGRGYFAGKLVQINLHRLWMQRSFDNLPRVAHFVNMAERVYNSFRTEPGPDLFAGGVEMPPTGIMRHGHAHDYHQRSSGFTGYSCMSLPVEDMASLGATMAALDLTSPRDAVLVTPPAAAMARLQRLYTAAVRLADEAPEIIANPEAARGLEQTLIEAMVACLGHAQQHENTLAQGQHTIVMRRFHRVVEENPEEPLYIPEIYKAIRVSERTLRACCQEHLGMSPKRYLLLRRMQLARRALRAGVPEAVTVTEVATRYGFWQLGRFAVEYRALFEETPSATLQRQPV